MKGMTTPEDETIAEKVQDALMGDAEPPRASETPNTKIPTGAVILGGAAVATIAAIGLNQVQSVFAPTFLALTLVLTVRPIHRALINKGVPAWISACVTLTTLIGFLVALGTILVLSLTDVPQVLASYSGKFQQTVSDTLAFIESKGFETGDLNTLLSKIDYNQIIGFAWKVVDQLQVFGSIILITAMAMLFLTIDTLTLKARSRVMNMGHSHLAEALASFEGRARQYWVVSSVFGLIVAIFDAIALEALGVPLPLAWAVVSFVTNYIPNVGFLLGVIPPALMGLLAHDWVTMVWVIVLYCVINFVIQGLFQPKFTGDAVGLSPTITFISLFAWTIVIGPLGAILAVPLTLFFKALLVDSDPRTRWLDAFFISDTEMNRRYEEGIYNVAAPARDVFVEFRNPVPSSRLKRAMDKAFSGRRQPKKGAVAAKAAAPTVDGGKAPTTEN